MRKFFLGYLAVAAGGIGQNYSGSPVVGVDDVGYFVNSLVATYQINKKWKYVFDWSLFNTQVDAINYNHTAWGINNDLYYQYSGKLAFGIRFNYTSGDVDNGSFGNAAIGGLYGNFGAGARPWQALSLGANWTPTKWLVVKPEIRWDRADDDAGGWFIDKWLNIGSWRESQFSGGISTVVKF